MTRMTCRILLSSSCAKGRVSCSRLHSSFRGTAGKANYAVKAQVLLDLLSKHKVKAAVSTGQAVAPAGGSVAGPAEGEDEAPALTVADYADRKGYDPAFLRISPNAQNQDVPLPTLPGDLLDKAVRVQAGNGGQKTIADCELKYNHFSVFMNGERRMAFFTVVNVDGQSLKW